MGNVFSGLTKEDILGIKESGCIFTEEEIKKYYRRFKDLDKDEVGRIYLESLLCIPEISINPLGEQVVKRFYFKINQMDFKGFLNLLSFFSKRTKNKEKMKIFYQMLCSGEEIERKDLEDIAHDLYGGEHEKEEIERAVDEIFIQYNRKGKDTIRYKDIEALDCSTLNILE
ncbi:calcineurin B-like proteinous protein 1 [Nematocida sp. LUAm3]|nr:calcineurin B-like proteinous protein 1 [Nematocida sp. LUAm3]KAI5174686.1 calcineurin B-like proteinous protein 1 [Nematocida sp. LUAm2]KAI5177903.1 calcineurin B-like proteinous protein 1 [Nematocida sp. LUAm1]